MGAWKVPTFSAREWRSAALATDGANGSWTWHDVERRRRQQLLDRARDVDRQRRGAPAAGGQVGQDLADGEHARRRAGLGQQRLGRLARGPQRLARLAHGRLRARGRDDHDPVPAAAPARRHTRSTYVLTSWRRLPGVGVTWAMARGAAGTGRGYAGAAV